MQLVSKSSLWRVKSMDINSAGVESASAAPASTFTDVTECIIPTDQSEQEEIT